MELMTLPTLLQLLLVPALSPRIAVIMAAIFSFPGTITGIIVSAASISLGMAVGGGKVIKTVGLQMTMLRPVHGFVAETAAATVVEIASAFSIPVSTTHCSSSAVTGVVGASRRLSAMKWGVAQKVMLAWIFTLPVCVALGWIFGIVLQNG